MQWHMVVVVVGVGASGCGGGGGSVGQAEQLCAHARKVCGADVIAASCPTDLVELAEPMGESFGKTIACGVEATSCPEIIGCFAGGVGQVFDRWANQFGKGVDRMRDRPHRRDPFSNPFESKDVLSSCTGFKVDDAKSRASWTGCEDQVTRAIVCKPFMGSLSCDCLEDGVKKWFFDADDLQLARRADAERIATANCKMSFGN